MYSLHTRYIINRNTTYGHTTKLHPMSRTFATISSEGTLIRTVLFTKHVDIHTIRELCSILPDSIDCEITAFAIPSSQAIRLGDYVVWIDGQPYANNPRVKLPYPVEELRCHGSGYHMISKYNTRETVNNLMLAVHGIQDFCSTECLGGMYLRLPGTREVVRLGGVDFLGQEDNETITSASSVTRDSGVEMTGVVYGKGIGMCWYCDSNSLSVVFRETDCAIVHVNQSFQAMFVSEDSSIRVVDCLGKVLLDKDINVGLVKRVGSIEHKFVVIGTEGLCVIDARTSCVKSFECVEDMSRIG